MQAVEPVNGGENSNGQSDCIGQLRIGECSFASRDPDQIILLLQRGDGIPDRPAGYTQQFCQIPFRRNFFRLIQPAASFPAE